jgi:hypothetical protein
MNVWMALVWIGIGMVILFFAIRELSWVLNISRNGVKTMGQIVELIEDTGSDPKQYYLVIEYYTQTGQVLQSKSRQSYINRRRNQQVEILYHKDYPETIVENKDKYFASLMGITLGSIVFIVGVANLL